MANCPVCKSTADAELRDYERFWRVTCRGCGRFELQVGLGEELADDLRPRLSHAIRLRQQENKFVEITRDLVSKLTEAPLPSLREQMDNLLLFVGDRVRLQDPVRSFDFQPVLLEMVATIGAYDSGSVGLLLDNLAQSRAVYWDQGENIRLLEAGWQRYQDLKTAAPHSRRAFMAMPFGNELLDKVFSECWQPAVARAGFELKTVLQRAGQIDDHIRVDI